MATLGATIYVLSAALSLFSQEVLVYKTGRSPSRSSGASLTAVSYANIDDDYVSSLDPSIIMAVTVGVVNSNNRSLPDLVPNCQSNCTFPLFDSLGLCVKVVDITTSLVKTEVFNASKESWSVLSGSDYQTNGSLGKIYNSTSGVDISLPSGASLISPLPVVFQLSPLNQSIAFSEQGGEYRSGILDLAFIGTQVQLDDMLEAPSLSYSAYEILFYMCVNTYNVTVSGGVTNSVITSSYSTPASMRSTPGPTSPVVCSSTDWSACKSRHDSAVEFNVSGVRYAVSRMFVQYLGAALSQQLSGWWCSDFEGNAVFSGLTQYIISSRPSGLSYHFVQSITSSVNQL